VPAAEEFREFYGLTTVVFPPNVGANRVDEPDVVFTHRDAKLKALADEIARVQATGRPVLVGTASVRSRRRSSAPSAIAGSSAACSTPS